MKNSTWSEPKENEYVAIYPKPSLGRFSFRSIRYLIVWPIAFTLFFYLIGEAPKWALPYLYTLCFAIVLYIQLWTYFLIKKNREGILFKDGKFFLIRAKFWSGKFWSRQYYETEIFFPDLNFESLVSAPIVLFNDKLYFPVTDLEEIPFDIPYRFKENPERLKEFIESEVTQRIIDKIFNKNEKEQNR